MVKAQDTNMIQPMSDFMPNAPITPPGPSQAGGLTPPHRPAPRPTASRPVPHAFTLIELLAVIAIIVILMGMLFVGMRYVGGSAKTKSTKVTLGNLQSMLATYDAQGRNMLSQLTAAYANYSPAYNPLPAPTNVSDDGSDRYAPAVVLTKNLAGVKLMAVPENKAAADKLSTSMLQPNATVLLTAPTHILLDAWGNPIIFVPAGGLAGVTLKADSSKLYLIQSTGVTAYTGTAPTLTGGRPFFASAGPDGDFSKGDDNLYSFEQ